MYPRCDSHILSSKFLNCRDRGGAPRQDLHPQGMKLTPCEAQALAALAAQGLPHVLIEFSRSEGRSWGGLMIRLLVGLKIP